MRTTLDIRREHEAALAALTPEQRRALTRLTVARNAARMNDTDLEIELERLFAREAEDLNEEALQAAA